jgi:hypothetical protein
MLKMMNKSVLTLLCLLSIGTSLAQVTQKTKCDGMMVDILDGKVNRTRPDYTPDRIKLDLPCFTSSEDESDSAKCGGFIEYKDKDLIFYTAKDYVEVGPKYNGGWTIRLMGAKKGTLFNQLGNPGFRATDMEGYQTAYGTLLLYYDTKGMVRLVRMVTKPIGLISLCE